MDAGNLLARRQEVAEKLALVLQRRTEGANEKYRKRVTQAVMPERTSAAEVLSALPNPFEFFRYAVDVAQRSILFWDTLRQRGNNFVEHARRACTPVLHFDYEIVLDGRTFERPVNYALVRIAPPEGVIVDPTSGVPTSSSTRAPATARASAASRTIRRSASRCARAIPVYFVIFFRDPEPGQTLLDVCDAEQQFVKKVRELHPDSPKPAIVGNCQGGWAAMMLAASRPRRHRPDRDQRRADVVLGRRVERRRGRQPDALRGRHARRHLARVARGRPGQRHVRRRLSGPELREPQSGQHPLGQVLPPVRQRRHRAAALPRVRALVGRLLPDEPRGDRVDHAQPLRRQQALVRRRQGRAAARPSTCATSRRRSSCSPRWATTSRRRSRRSTGSPTSTAAPTRSRRAARSSSACCTRTSATSASSSPARWRRRSTRRSSRC